MNVALAALCWNPLVSMNVSLALGGLSGCLAFIFGWGVLNMKLHVILYGRNYVVFHRDTFEELLLSICVRQRLFPMQAISSRRSAHDLHQNGWGEGRICLRHRITLVNSQVKPWIDSSVGRSSYPQVPSCWFWLVDMFRLLKPDLQKIKSRKETSNPSSDVSSDWASTLLFRTKNRLAWALPPGGEATGGDTYPILRNCLMVFSIGWAEEKLATSML